MYVCVRMYLCMCAHICVCIYVRDECASINALVRVCMYSSFRSIMDPQCPSFKTHIHTQTLFILNNIITNKLTYGARTHPRVKQTGQRLQLLVCVWGFIAIVTKVITEWRMLKESN